MRRAIALLPKASADSRGENNKARFAVSLAGDESALASLESIRLVHVRAGHVPRNVGLLAGPVLLHRAFAAVFVTSGWYVVVVGHDCSCYWMKDERRMLSYRLTKRCRPLILSCHPDRARVSG